MLIYKKHCITAFLLLLLMVNAFGQSGNEVLELSANIKAEKGKLVEEYTYLIQINNKQSDWISDVSIPYRGGKLDILEASILDAKGQVVRTLKKKEILSRSAMSQGSFYEDSFIKEFNLKWNEYPYRIKYSYRRVSSQFLGIANWSPVIDTNVPTRKASLTVQLPLDYKVNLNYSQAFKFSADTLGNSCTLRWEASAIGPVSTEILAPPLWEVLPKVTIVPKEFVYGLAGSFESWTSYGKWGHELNKGLDVLPLSEQVVVDKLIEGVKDKKEIVRILYHHLQDHTRYINVSIDIGGMKPYPASYVCANKYGDCKALTIYMKALLKHAGIESIYTDVYAGENPVKINPKLPAQQFNHVLLCVPLQGDTLWLENTASYLPYNYLGTFTQNRQVLLVGESSRLARTPALSLADVLQKTSYTFELDGEGAGMVFVESDLRGELFERFKYLQHEQSQKDLKEAIEEAFNTKSYELLKWKMAQANRDEPLLKLQLEVQVSNQIRRLGSTLVLSPTAYKIPRLEDVNSRKEQVRINFPVNETESFTYKLPFISQYKTKLPQDITIETKYGKYLERYQLAAGEIGVTRSFQLFSGEFPKEEYPGFYAFIESVKDAQKKSAIVLNPL